jgi:hypothetical protein
MIFNTNISKLLSLENAVIVTSTIDNRFCTYPECNKVVLNKNIGLCPRCIYKITHFEERLDRWLSVYYPDISLEDVVGWYQRCSKDECKRECLEEGFYIQGCTCCPCHLELQYIPHRIDNQILPSNEWMKEITDR